MCLPELYKSGRNVVLVLVSVVIVEVNKPVTSPVNDRKDIKSTVWQTRHTVYLKYTSLVLFICIYITFLSLRFLLKDECDYF